MVILQCENYLEQIALQFCKNMEDFGMKDTVMQMMSNCMVSSVVAGFFFWMCSLSLVLSHFENKYDIHVIAYLL